MLYHQSVRILGVDPGSVTTGFGVIDYDRGRLVLVEQGTIATQRGADLADRLCRIHEELTLVIARTMPAVVAVETPFAGLNMKSLIQLSHARGVILLAARTAQLAVYEYAPSTVKSAVAGYGAAEKTQVAKMVSMLMKGCPPMRPDASDALAIAICHAHTSGTMTRLRVRA